MTQSTKDQLEGSLHEAVGAVKDTVGRILRIPDLSVEGQDEHLAGTVQKKIGQIEKVFEK